MWGNQSRQAAGLKSEVCKKAFNTPGNEKKNQNKIDKLCGQAGSLVLAWEQSQ